MPKNPLDRQSGEVASHTLDVQKLGSIFDYLLKGEGSRKLAKGSWDHDFVTSMERVWRKCGARGFTEDSLIRLEQIYCKY